MLVMAPELVMVYCGVDSSGARTERMRIILYTGKGGVGKTSVAAATALRAAQQGQRTLVMSTDAAHSLGDSFDVPLSGEPRLLAPNLWAQELDVLREVDVHWATLKEWMTTLLGWGGNVNGVLAEEMAILPGMEEMAGLLYLLEYYNNDAYDLVVVDCAPTGETLRLLSFPEVMRWWMDRLFPMQRQAMKVLRPFARTMLNMPAPDDRVFAAVEDIFARLDRMKSILGNPDVTSMRMVVNLEKMVIKEAQRLYTYLNLYGFATDMIVVNRVIPAEVTDPFFVAWRESQAKWEGLVQEAFSPLAIRHAPLMDHEVVGMEMLSRVADHLFGEDDPARVYYRGAPQELTKEDGVYVLRLQLPFVEKRDVQLSQAGNELNVAVGNHKRNIVLPTALAGHTAAGAKLEQDYLNIRFEKVQATAP